MSSSPRFRIAEIPGKGRGLVTTTFIPRGTLIVEEAPAAVVAPHTVISLKPNEWLATLSPSTRESFLSLPPLGKVDPVRARFKHFLPLGDGDRPDRGFFPVICAANYSCLSNATYYWNEDLGKEVLHATFDIQSSSEIVVTYGRARAEQGCTFPSPTEQTFGFVCDCALCARPVELQRESVLRLKEVESFVERAPGLFGRWEALRLLAEFEKNIKVCLEEGVDSELATRCYDVFQLCAYYGDETQASAWAKLAGELWKISWGIESPQVATMAKLERNPKSFRAWAGLGRKKLPPPSDLITQFAFGSPSRILSRTAGAPAILPPPVPIPSDSEKKEREMAVQMAGLSIGQKKKLRQKRKKEAETAAASGTPATQEELD